MLNLLNEVSDSKFVTRKWNIVNDHRPFQDRRINNVRRAMVRDVYFSFSKIL